MSIPARDREFTFILTFYPLNNHEVRAINITDLRQLAKLTPLIKTDTQTFKYLSTRAATSPCATNHISQTDFPHLKIISR